MLRKVWKPLVQGIVARIFFRKNSTHTFSADAIAKTQRMRKSASLMTNMTFSVSVDFTGKVFFRTIHVDDMAIAVNFFQNPREKVPTYF